MENWKVEREGALQEIPPPLPQTHRHSHVSDHVILSPLAAGGDIEVKPREAPEAGDLKRDEDEEEKKTHDGPLQEHDDTKERRRLSEQQKQQRRRSSISHRPSLNARLRRISILEDDDWHEREKETEAAAAAIKKAKENAYTLMEKECAAEDVIRTWEIISKFIIFQMLNDKGVRIAGLGTFTYRVHKTPVNQKTMKVTKIPVFILSEYVIQMYRLKQDKVPVSAIPVVPLNMSVISLEANLPRGIVEGIVTEVLQAFARGIVCNKHLEFPFASIGKLQIRDSKVTMRFYEEFCKRLGVHVVETPYERKLLHNLIPGRMTPLRLHIPSEDYRSVFHLREVRSVHELPLAVPGPVVNFGGRLVIPTTESQEKKLKVSKNESEEEEEEEEEGDNEEEEDKSGEAEEDEEEEDEEEEEYRQQKSHCFSEKKPPVKPLYVPQRTGNCLLDLMNSCPQSMMLQHGLRAHMYKTMIDLLGMDTIRTHFDRPVPQDDGLRVESQLNLRQFNLDNAPKMKGEPKVKPCWQTY